MSVYKEIVTKAIIGKGKKKCNTACQISPDIKPDTILGCWVINHHFSGSNVGGQSKVNGGFDINVWYSYDNNTKTNVANGHFDYVENMNVHLKNDAKLSSDSQIIVRSLKQPTVTDVNIDNGIIKMNVEKELGVEIVGETMVKVSVEEDEDDYEIIEDDNKEEVINEIEKEVDEDYLK